MWLLLLVPLLFAVSTNKPLHAAPPVGVAQCATCHAEIARAYAKTGMGRSFARLKSSDIAEMKTPYHHAASKTYFRILHRGADVVHRRWQIGPDGKETNEEQLRIDYVLGSGNHARTYLHRNTAGVLVELPLGWYAEDGGVFAMNPGFDTPHPETRRKIDFDCMACHNAYPRIEAGHKQPGAEPVFGNDMPEGINCQRCHGSGDRHATLATTAGAQAKAIRDAIVNPSRLPPERQLDVCMQCHLETTSTRLPGMIRRFDRDPFSFVPGEPLKDYVLFFDHAPGSGREDKFEIVSSAYRLRRSQCFLKSPSMTCTTCHDPHGRSGAQSLVERNAAACKSCHKAALAELTTAGQHPPGPDCAGCHMPKRRTADAVHVVMTDHLIQRRPPPGDLLARRAERHPRKSEEYRGPVVPYYPALPADALYNAVAQVLHGSNLTPGIPQLDAEIARRRPPEAEFYVTLGNAWQQIDRPDKAAAAFAEAVRLKPKSARELRYWGIALMQSGRSAAAAEAFKRAIAISPSDAVSWYQLGLIASGKGRSAEAVEKAAKAVSFDPDLLDAQNSLAVNLSALGDVGRAEAVFRSALRVNPYYATTHANLARLLAARGDLPPALMHFEEAIRFRADFAPDRYEYALALVRSNRFEEAAPQAEAAIQYDPKMVEARTLLGGLHARAGRLDDARIEYETALSLRPDHGRAHLDLARVLAAQGQLPQAIDHLRQAMKSLDPSSARQAAQALQRLQSLQK